MPTEKKETKLKTILNSTTGKTTIVIVGVLGGILLIGVSFKVLAYASKQFRIFEATIRQ